MGLIRHIEEEFNLSARLIIRERVTDFLESGGELVEEAVFSCQPGDGNKIKIAAKSYYSERSLKIRDHGPALPFFALQEGSEGCKLSIKVSEFFNEDKKNFETEVTVVNFGKKSVPEQAYPGLRTPPQEGAEGVFRFDGKL